MSIELVAQSQFDLAVADLVQRTRCRPVRGEEFEDVCRLRYDAYRREGALPEGAPLRFSDRFDDEPNTRTFGMFVDGELIGSIRIHHVSPEWPEHPGLYVFRDFTQPLIDAGRVLIDTTRFVADAEGSRRFPKLAYMAMRLPYMAGVWFGADILLAAVRTEHQAFYKRLAGHRVVCPARPYPTLAKPISLTAMDFAKDRYRLERRHRFFGSTHEERRALFGDMGSSAPVEAGLVA